MKKIGIICLIAFFVILFFSPAFGQTEDEALRFFKQGLAAFLTKKYQEALDYFEKSLKIFVELNHYEGIPSCLNYIGHIYNSMGQYENALEYHKNALKILKKLNRPPHSVIPPEYISGNLLFIGKDYFCLGQYENALPYYKKSMEIIGRFKNPEKSTQILNEVGLVYRALGQYEKALKYHEETLEISRKYNIHQYIGISLNNIGDVYKSLDQYKKALKYYTDALNIKKQHNSPPQSKATTLNNIGRVYYLYGRYVKALFYYIDALKNYEKSDYPKENAECLQRIGDVYIALGIYDKALSFYELSLKIREALKLPRDIATCWGGIGLIYHYLGQYEKAILNYERALYIYEKLGIKDYISICLSNIGGIYYLLGQYEKALSSFKKAFKISIENNNNQNISLFLNNIGNVYTALGQYEKAVEYYEDALKRYRILKMPQFIAATLINIAFVYLDQKRYKEAEKKFTEAYEAEKRTGYKMTPTGLVELYLATGRNPEALSLLKKIKPKWYTDAVYRIQYHIQSGLALKGTAKLKAASVEFLKAISLIEEMRRKVKQRTEFLSAGYPGGRIRAYRGLFSVLSERALDGEKRDEQFTQYGINISSCAFYFAELAKARVLLESMTESEKQERKMGLPEGLRKKEKNLLNQLSAIESQWEKAYKKGEEAFSELQERKNKLTVQLNRLIKEIRETYPGYAALYYPKPTPPEELPLRANEVLIEYALADDTGYVFVVKKSSDKNLIKIPVGREALEEKVKTFMEPLNSEQYWEFSITKAKELYDILLSEVLKEIKEDEKIIIVPDGILGLLPFDALVIKPGRSVKDSLYVGDKYNLSYYQSASVMAFQRRFKHKKAEKTLFALGNPVFNAADPRYQDYKQGKPIRAISAQSTSRFALHAQANRRIWAPIKDDKEEMGIFFRTLPETEIEVKEIAKLFGIQPVPPDVLLDVMANETELRKVELDKYRYIHFATHADLPGKIQGVQEPFLLLGQVENKRKDDGFLTLSEVLGLKLNADLVVLSACVTGVGKHMEGEGVVNFARAFQYAGAESVVVSLWKVYSPTAVEYMEDFYGNLKSGYGIAEALRLARTKIKSKYPNPFYWAVFILHGEGEFFKNSENPSYIKPESKLSFPGWMGIFSAVIIVLILVVFIFRRKKADKKF